MNHVLDTDFARAHLDPALAGIPLAGAMQIALRDYDGERLVLTAPLAPNVNDKGCAFGGSLASVLTLAGWGLIELKLRSLGHDCDIYVQDSTIRYLAPLWDDLIASAALAEGESWQTFLGALQSRGRGRLRMVCRVPLGTDQDACTLEARFVAIARKSPTATA
jgi:thioesterase domain-containing protein